MGEGWAYARLFIVLPFALALGYHVIVYVVTGRSPDVDWNGDRCGSGRMTYDC